MTQRDFGLKEPFDVDNGELDGLRPNEIFVLGYELAMVHHEVDETPGAFEKVVHAKNKDRIEASLNRREREHRWTWPNDDSSEEWVYIHVMPYLP